MEENNKYSSPLSSRYASKYMLNLFSYEKRSELWRELWLELAKKEKELGLNITDEQIRELEVRVKDIDYQVIAEKEKEIRHDVMAHIYAYGKVAPIEAGIIHLGATSCYVADNADLIIYKDGLNHILNQLLLVIKNMSEIALKYKDLPTLGYTHYQPAQFVTLGKRFTLYIQDLVSDVNEIKHVIDNLKFLGCKGATGTEASLMDLFNNDETKIEALNKNLAHHFGFFKCFDVSGQTYARKTDSRILYALSGIAESCYKFANDMRLMQHDRIVEEPFEDKQIGSSAMPYKRNPMRSERICSLARYIMVDALNAPLTSSTQWFERTLDDSANRRISLPEAFLSTDSILKIMNNITTNLVVNTYIIEKLNQEYLPFIASENILMEAVKKGGNRQDLHEVIRQVAMKATKNMKEGRPSNFLNDLSEHPSIKLSKEEINKLLDSKLYIGRSSSQVTNYINSIKSLYENISIKEEALEL